MSRQDLTKCINSMVLSDSEIAFCELPQRSRNGIFIRVHHFSMSINTEQTEHLCKWILRLVRTHKGFFLPSYEGNFDMELKILFLFTYLYFCHTHTRFLFSDNWTFENGSELFDHLLGYHITFQNNRTRPVMNLWESCSGPQESSPLLQKSKRSKIFLRRAFQTLFNNYNDRWISMK